MSKIAQYLNEHILGEVVTDAATRRAFSTDASILTLMPEMVVYPRVTNDVRKIARFSWQLAEKGHILPITVRGGGSDQTGGAIGKGAIVNTTAHMNTIFELDTKQRLVRLQPGVMFKTLNDALALHGLHVPSYPASYAYSTIGGAIAKNASGILSGKYGATDTWVNQLEVVLANGDVLQTGRLSKRDLNRKKGLQTFEGEIYRQIDNLISDNKALIDDKIKDDVRNNLGYSGIARVKQKDGSFDLAPLFLGSQGTLGIISEVIMKAEFLNHKQTVAIASFATYDTARDAIDELAQLNPAALEVIDATLFERAIARGKKYAFYKEATDKGAVGAVVLFIFDDMNDRAQKKKMKKARKLLKARDAYTVAAEDEPSRLELLALRDVSWAVVNPEGDDTSAPPLMDGVYVPLARFEDFSQAVGKLAEKYHVELPLYGHALEGVFHVRPALQMHKVADKQKVFKLLTDYATLVAAHNGHLIGEAAEGRLKAPFAYKELDTEEKDLYVAIKDIFDPNGILNPGVKQSGELKLLIAALRSDYDTAAFANYSPTN